MTHRNLNTFLSVVLVGLISSVMSFVLLGNYINGDQKLYHNFYNLIQDVPFSEVGPIALSTISSAEPLSWLVLWVGSTSGIDKNIWISFLNVILIVGIYILLRKHDARWFVFVLMLTNFYILVLMTGAERLKIAYILLVWAFVLEGKWRFLLALLSPLAHLQSFILLFSAGSAYMSNEVRRVSLTGKLLKKKFLLFFMSFCFFAVIFVFLQNGIMRKATSYYSGNIYLTDLFNVGLLLVIGLLVSRDKLRMILALLPLAVAITFLGGERVNMIAISVFIGLLMFERRLSHPLVLLMLIYFSTKSIPFILNIYRNGSGFVGPLW